MDQQEDIIKSYKLGESNEQEINEVPSDEFDLDFPDSDDGEQRDIPHSSINALEARIQKSNDPFSKSALREVAKLVVKIDPKFLDNISFDRLIFRLPHIEHLDSSSKCFKILAHITRNKQVCEYYSDGESEILPYEEFPSASIKVQDRLVTFLCNLIANDNEDHRSARIEFYYEAFFKYFIEFLTGPTAYMSKSLYSHLYLLGYFVDSEKINMDDLEQAFDVFKTFINRTTSDCITASLVGLCRCLKINREFIRLVNDDATIQQIEFCAQRRCINEDAEALEVRMQACVVLEFIVTETDVQFSSAYPLIVKLLMDYFDAKADYRACVEGTILFGFCVANNYFKEATSDEEIQLLIAKFMDVYDWLTFADKIEWVTAYANILYYIEPPLLEEILIGEDNSPLIHRLLQCIALDNDDTVGRLMIALLKICRLSPAFCTVLSNNEFIDALNEALNDFPECSEGISTLLKQLTVSSE